MMLPSKTLLLAAAASALYVRPQRTLRRQVTMKWGEHIDQVKGDNTFLRNVLSPFTWSMCSPHFMETVRRIGVRVGLT